MNPLESFRRLRSERHSKDEARIMQALHPGLHYYGYPLSRSTGLRPGRLYPALNRLMEKGAVEDGWDLAPMTVGNGGPRRWYRITEREVLSGRDHILAQTVGLRLQAVLGELSKRHPGLGR